MKLLDRTPNLYPSEKAEQVARDLSRNDPDWTYKAIHDPEGTGFSFIEVYDEEDEFVGYF